MSIALKRPGVDELRAVVSALRDWQHDGVPMQLHPGDLGWYWRFGAEATAAAVRTWSRDGQILAIGLLDGPGLVRMAIAPDAQQDLVRHLVAELTESERDVPLHAAVEMEARCGELFRGLLLQAGWSEGEPWTPLSRDLAEPVEHCGLRIELIGSERADVRVAVQRAAFDRSTFTDESWRTMASGVPYADASCLVAFDDQDAAVAAATVWSGGRGRPGLLEPLGVHREHRGRGYGVAIATAAAGALRELGSSSAIVCTETANVGAVATYMSAGFRQHPQVRDLRRPADQGEGEQHR